ncbi:MAG: tautomerase family protein [Rhizobiaceae bacterium]|nr:tautomerase family protein [Rhizobiaceae bacterium]
MPHVILKIASGKSDDEKTALAMALTEAVTKTLACDEKFVSVAVEDVEVSNWADQVFIPEIAEKPGQIFKKPGYDPRS